jgi:hypothetical protein
VVLVAVETNQVRRDPIPYRARRDALGGKEHPLGHLKSRVAQHRVHEVVGQQFWSVRSERDRRLQSGLADDFVGFLGMLGVLVIDLWQAGIEYGRAGRSVNGDGHSGLLVGCYGTFGLISSMTHCAYSR